MDHTALVKDVVARLKALDPFPVASFMDRLFNMTRNAPAVSQFKNDVKLAAAFGPPIEGVSINGRDESVSLDRLGIQSVTLAIESLSKPADKPGFKACVRAVPQNNASEDLSVELTNMVPILFEEYVNWTLTNGGLPPLEKLHDTAGFAAAFQQFVSSPKFIATVIFEDLVSADRTLSTALIFVCEYLHRGPGFPPLLGVDFASSASAQVLDTWVENLVLEPSLKGAADVAKIFDFAVQVASIVSVPADEQGKPQQSIGVPLRSLVMSSVFKPAVKRVMSRSTSSPKAVCTKDIKLDKTAPEQAVSDDQLDEMVQGAQDNFKSIANRCRLNWETRDRYWANAVSKKATVTTQTSRKFMSSGSGTSMIVITQPNQPPREKEFLEITTHTGRALADWIHDAKKSYPALFTEKSPKVTEVTTAEITQQSGGACFRPGTMVATATGDIAIENITEGTVVLTDSTGGRMGICSDEDVTIETANPFLVGFNGAGVFATMGHIFHTTSGLRAIDPKEAIEENPWADVGKLQPGHVVYRLSEDRRSYTLMPIQTIQIEQVPSVQTVHGVHLREGERSYHANGYLVAVNYPEITIKSVAAALEKLPREDRVLALLKIKELRPLFWKLGIKKMDELLHRELKAARTGKMKTKRHFQGVRFQEMCRTLTPQVEKSNLVETRKPDGYELPNIEIFDSILILDGQVVERVALDPVKMSLRWSREIGTLGYEHGLMIFNKHGFGASGAVLITENENPSEIHEDEANIVPFSCGKAPISKSRHGRDRPADRTTTRVDSGPICVTKEPEPTSPTPAIPVADIDIEEPSAADVNLEELTEGYTVPIWDESWYFITYVDEEEWPKEAEVRTNCIRPKSFGTLGLGVYYTHASNALQVASIIIPQLDQLLEDYNNSCEPYQRLASIYESQMVDNADGTVHAKVQITAAATIATLSDQYSEPDGPQVNPVYPTKDLTFQQKLNSEVAIPLLFAEAEIDFDYWFDDFDGAVWEYDPEMTGFLGNRYCFESRWDLSARSFDAVAAQRSEVSIKAAAQGVKRSAVIQQTAAGEESDVATSTLPVSPASATSTMAKAAALTDNALDRLIKTQYSEREVNDRCQAEFQKLMLYYMDQADREAFTTFARPQASDFSSGLLNSLSAEMKAWIKDTYGKAYISYSLSKMSMRSEEPLRHKLTGEEKEKIWYFWAGSGETCLSGSQTYQDINVRISLYVTRDILGEDFRTEFLPNGRQWALDMIGRLDNERFLSTFIVRNANLLEGNILNRWCNLAHCLSPALEGDDFDFASELFSKVFVHFQSINQKLPGTLPESILGYETHQWITDSIGHLIDLVYDGESELDPGLREMILEDLNDLAAALAVSADATAEERKAQLLQNFTIGATALGAILPMFGQTLFASGKAQTIHRAVSWALTTGGGELSPRAISAMRGPLAMGTFVAFAMLSSGLAGGWDVLSPEQRVACGLQMTKIWCDWLTGAVAIFRDYKAAQFANARTSQVIDGIVSSAMRKTRAQGRMALLHAMAKGSGPEVDELRLRQQYNFDLIETDLKKGKYLSIANKNTIWNERLNLRDEALGDNARSAPLGKTNMSYKLLSGIGLAVGLAAFIGTSVSLTQEMDNLTLRGRRLARAQIAFMALSVVVEGAGLVAWGALALAVPFVGVIVAVVGVVLAILFGRKGVQKEEEPPLSETERWISDQAKPLIASLVTPPSPQMTYTVSPDSWPGNATRVLRIAAQNTGAEDAVMRGVSLFFTGGDDDVCLFQEATLTNMGMIGSGTGATIQNGGLGVIGVERLPGTGVPLKADLISDQYTSTFTGFQSFVVREVIRADAEGGEGNTVGEEDPLGSGDPVVVIPTSKGFTWILKGKVNPIQVNEENDPYPGESTLEIVELLPNGDKTRYFHYIQRT